MKKFNGTEGKWVVKHSESKTAYNVIGTSVGCKYKIARCPYINDEDFCDDFNKKEEREARANAHLIAAAPDMLEVLQWLDSVGGKGIREHEEIRRVINKALGINE